MRHSVPQQMRILVVDDNPVNVMVLERTLATAGYSNIKSTGDPAAVVMMCCDEPPDLILLDLHMPEVTGFEVMAALAKLPPKGPPPPILVVTADNTAEVRKRALSYGAIDFVTSPFDRGELELRVRNHLHARRLALELEALAGDQEERARRAENALDGARMEVLERLAHAAEFRDDESRLHTWRVGRLSGMIADARSLAPGMCEQLSLAARLHDVGKIAVPDEILFKRGSLDPAEWEVVCRHTTVGAQILSGSTSPLVALAESIARSHHERWDGGGYPDGLREAEIPLPARIVAVADVFDVLTHERPYGDAWTHERARAHLNEQRRRQFDPEMVDAFLALDPGTLPGSADVASSTPPI
ncbi:MAG: HD domain-containing phosphohydrolase [Solirubrobacteraceae bacterium]